MEIPELYSVHDSSVLNWFQSHAHLTDKDFFHGLLTSELKNPNSILRSNPDFAKYCLRNFLNSETFRVNSYNSDGLQTCLNILTESGNFEPLFEFTVKFEDKMVRILDYTQRTHMAALADALMVSAFKDQFFDILMRHDSLVGFKINLFFSLIMSDVTEAFFIDKLTLDPSVFRTVIGFATTKCLAPTLNEPVLEKIVRIYEAARIPEAVEDLPFIKLGFNIIKADKKFTLRRFGINAFDLPSDAKAELLIIAGVQGKTALFTEIFNAFTSEEKLRLLIHLLNNSNNIYSTGLKVASKLYNLMSNDERTPVHKTKAYIKAAVSLMKFVRFDRFDDGENYFKVTFEANAEQIAAGSFDEMIYYETRDPVSAEFHNFIFKLKFISAEAFGNFISQDLGLVDPLIPQQGIIINKDTMKLLGSSEHLRRLIQERDYKITFLYYPEVFGYLEETSLEDIPDMSNILGNYAIHLQHFSLINSNENIEKIERLTGKNVVDLIKEIFAASYEIGEKDYFLVRNALIYAKERVSTDILNQLPFKIKYSLAKEFPELMDLLTL